MDYYQILGITKGASDSEIKAAYRKKALEWHPDRNKSPQASEKFKEVTKAYEVLSDSQKRQTYDQYGESAFDQSAQGGWGQQQGPFTYSYRSYGDGNNPFEGMDFGGFSDPFDIFEQFFGGGFSQSRKTARRQVYSLSLSFMEAAKGVEKTVKIEGKNMAIKIPPGVDNGSRVRFGNFDVLISVEKDSIFERDGLNLYVTLDVDFVSAALGSSTQIPTLDGNIELKIPPGTQPETVIRLRGRGITDPHGHRTGDQFVRIKIKVPTKLSHQQKEILETLRDASSEDKKRGPWF